MNWRLRTPQAPNELSSAIPLVRAWGLHVDSCTVSKYSSEGIQMIVCNLFIQQPVSPVAMVTYSIGQYM